MLKSASRYLSRRGRNFSPVKGYIPIPGRTPTVCSTPEEAVSHIKSDDRVFIHEIAATPHTLLNALAKRAGEVKNVEFTGIFPTKSEPLHAAPDSFKANLHFVGPHDRAPFNRKSPQAGFIPMYLHEVSQHLRSPDFPIDVAMMTLSPPDKHGWCSMGPSICVGKPGVEKAKVVIAEITPHCPRTLGNTMIHYSHLDYVYQSDRQLPQYAAGKLTEEQLAIGKLIAEIIPDGACLQAGIGGVPDAVLGFLKNHKNLGIHTEMFAEGLIDLIQSGAVTNSEKSVIPGKVTACFVMGTDRLYNFIDDNSFFHFEPAEFTNNPYIISRNKKFVAINSALSVDLTGQVCADTMGPRQFSGVGGQVDFVRGANMSEDGRAIIALPATASKGKYSRITTFLDKGSSVTTGRWEGPTIVTEFGVADLWGKSTRERSKALISIAHPKFREELEKNAHELYGKEIF